MTESRMFGRDPGVRSDGRSSRAWRNRPAPTETAASQTHARPSFGLTRATVNHRPGPSRRADCRRCWTAAAPRVAPAPHTAPSGAGVPHKFGGIGDASRESRVSAPRRLRFPAPEGPQRTVAVCYTGTQGSMVAGSARGQGEQLVRARKESADVGVIGAALANASRAHSSLLGMLGPRTRGRVSGDRPTRPSEADLNAGAGRR